MTIHGGTNYTPMDNLNNGGNPTNPPSLSPLEDMMRDMRARFDAMDNNYNDARTETSMSNLRRDRYNDQ